MMMRRKADTRSTSALIVMGDLTHERGCGYRWRDRAFNSVYFKTLQKEAQSSPSESVHSFY